MTGRGNLEERKRLARAVLESVDGWSPEALRGLGQALVVAGRPLDHLGFAFEDLATTVEAGGDAPGAVAVIRLARGLRVVATDADIPVLLRRFEAAPGEPWRSLHEAVAEVALAPVE